MLNNIILNYSFITIFKITFILFLLITAISLVCLESKKIEPELPEYKSAGILGDLATKQSFRRIGRSAATIIGLYASAIAIKGE